MATYRKSIFLDTETWGAILTYQQKHKKRFRSQSAAVQHLLRRALSAELDEDEEAVIAPVVRATIHEAVTEAVERRILPLMRGQTNAIADIVSGRRVGSTAAAKRPAGRVPGR